MLTHGLMRHIITPEELRKYAATRLLPKGSDISELNNLKSLNIKMMMTEDEFRHRNGLKQVIDQDFRRESIFLNDGQVHIPIVRGFYRLKHYQDIARHLQSNSLNMDVDVEYYGGTPDAARYRLDHLAKNLAEEILSTERKFDVIFIGPLRSAVDTFFGSELYSKLDVSDKEFKEQKEETVQRLLKQEESLAAKYKNSGLDVPARSVDEILKDARIDPLVISNLIHNKSYDSHTRELVRSFGVERVDDDFLDYQIFEKEGKTCLGLNYVYGDQIFYLLKHFFNEYVERDNKNKLHMVMYGKVGALKDDVRRGDVIIPSGIVKEKRYYPMDPGLIMAFQRKQQDRWHVGGNVHAVDSVLDQTYEGLSDAKDRECTLTEMEAYNVAKALNFCKNNIRGMPEVRFNFLGYASDVPLIGDTLAEELQDYSVIYEALDEVSDIILRD